MHVHRLLLVLPLKRLSEILDEVADVLDPDRVA